MNFDEYYFKSANYSSYLERGERYLKMAEELDDLFCKLKIIKKDSRIVDYGCAVGFLISALEKIGYTNIFGYDISEWAIAQAEKRGCKILKDCNWNHARADLMFCLDVFEHMEDKDITSLLTKKDRKSTRLNSSHVSESRMPSSA